MNSIFHSGPDTGAQSSIGDGVGSHVRRDEHLEALKLLVDHLGHEFNNMLVPVLGYVTLVSQELDPTSGAVPYAAKVESSGRRAESELEAILTTVRPQRRFNPLPGDLGQALEREVARWKDELPPGNEILMELEISSCVMTFDADHFASLIRHLLDNARHAMAFGGRICIKLGPKALSEQEAATWPSGTSGTVYELIVADDGYGMPSHVLKRACEPFFTTRQRGTARGLGLTAVHGIVQLHGGQLTLESEEDKGTRVIIWLPQEDFAAQVSYEMWADRGSKLVAASKDAKSVLLIEQDKVVREAFKGYLERRNIRVMVVGDEVEGLRLLRRDASGFGVIVLGRRNSGKKLAAVVNEITNLAPSARVVCFEGDLEENEKDASEWEGPKRPLLLKKPLAMRAFLDAIRQDPIAG